MYTKCSGSAALGAIAMAQFMIALDIAVVNVALPSIRATLGGWASATTATTATTLTAAVALLLAFIWVEARWATAPLIRLDLLRSRWVSGADLFVFFAATAQFAAFYFVSLYMQQALGMSPAATGAAFVPFSLGVIIGTVIATRLGTQYSPRTLLIPGALIAAVGFGWFALISPDGNFVADVLGPSVITSIGFGLCLAPVASAATIGVLIRDAGIASGLLSSARQLGGAIGLTALSTLAAGRIGTATSAAALTSGYAFALAVAAGLLVVAAAVLPTRRRTESTIATQLPTPVAAE
ncbi:MFS transporter [Nocardia sp. NPDC059239]|uniref:MFS transporter n=1 Tax=unclassified Nocardia TaxID=2637762 RepID=UPI0036C48A3C